MPGITTAPARAAFHPLRVAAVDRLCDDAVAVTFEVTEELRWAYDFEAGQSVTLRRFVAGAEERRTYSICAVAGSAPRIGVREIPGGGLFSSWLVNDVVPGQEIDVQSPSGSFRADPTQPARHLLIAAGSGITPMMSIAATVLANPATEVTLLYGNRTTGSVMFAEELADLKNRYPARFAVVHVLSREPRDVELFSGRLDAARLRALLGTLVPVASMDHVWLCGPFAMLIDAREVLVQLGVPAERVHAELFYVDEPPPEVHRLDAPADGATSQVSVVLDGVRTTTSQPRSRSILDAAAASRSDVPFACKGGVCGTCRALVREGAVDLRRNYALEPAELDAGYVLTCQSYPIGDGCTVDFDA